MLIFYTSVLFCAQNWWGIYFYFSVPYGPLFTPKFFKGRADIMRPFIVVLPRYWQGIVKQILTISARITLILMKIIIFIDEAIGFTVFPELWQFYCFFI